MTSAASGFEPSTLASPLPWHLPTGAELQKLERKADQLHAGRRAEDAKNLRRPILYHAGLARSALTRLGHEPGSRDRLTSRQRDMHRISPRFEHMASCLPKEVSWVRHERRGY